MLRNRTLTPALVLALLLAAGGGEAAAQENGPISEDSDNIGYGTRAAEFLLIPMGARLTALGQAATAIADDATAMYWNPAGISFLRAPSVHVSYQDYIAGTSYTWGGVAIPMAGGNWAVGVQLGGFDFGDQPVYTVEEPEGTGSTYSNSMFVAGLTGAMNVTDRFSFGVTGKFVQESFANTSGQTVAFDFGANYHTDVAGRRLMGAIALMNLGGEIQPSGADLEATVIEQDPNLPLGSTNARLRVQSFPLPVMFKAGLAYEALSTPTNQVLVSGEFWQPQHNSTSVAGGVEYTLRPEAVQGLVAALRGGYTYEPDRSFSVGESNFDDDGSDGLTFGGGLGYRPATGFHVSLDYAYRNLGLLPSTNMFSVTFGW